VLALLLALTLTTATTAAAAAVAGPRCEDGQYVVAGTGLVGDAGPSVLSIAERRIEILDACPPTRLRTKRRGRLLAVRGRWPRCEHGATNVRFSATLDRLTCRQLTGTVKSGSTRRPVEARKSTRLLVFTRTTGFRHASIADLQRVLGALAPATGIVPTLTEDPAVFTDEGLAAFDVVLFGNTTGDVLDDDQQAAMERFIRSGHGWVGVHSAADTEYAWPWYGRLVGAYFISHPILPVTVEVTTEDPDHVSTAHLPATFTFTDEIYNFDRNPRFDHSILLTIDEAGFTWPNFPPTASMGDDHPIAWYKEYDGGRSFYTNLGHNPVTWDDPGFVTHLTAGIRWAGEPIAYSRVVLTQEARNPMTLAVAPDGRVYYTERTGEVRVWTPETGRVIDAAVLPVDTTAENGLLGIALDPHFPDTGYVYLYHSEPVPEPPPASGPPGENVLSRFTAQDDGRLDPASRVDLLRVPSERECCHEGGSLAFAPDGTLYLSTGVNTNPCDSAGVAPLDERPGRERYNSQRTAQNPFDLRGKVLRINPDGSIPAGNMFPPSGSAGRPEIYTMGSRNPFRTTVDPDTGRLYWGEVGPDAVSEGIGGPRGYDEINFADGPGNYGWPHCIAQNLPYNDLDFATGSVVGAFTCDDTLPALLAYDYLTVTEKALGNAIELENGTITGRTAIAGTVYRRPAPDAPFVLPAPFRDVLLMTDWTRDVIAAVHLTPDDRLARVVRLLPWEKFRRPIDLEVGPDGALYVLEYGTGYFGDNSDAAVSRIEYSDTGGLSPLAVITATPTGGPAPLTVELSGAGSRAPGLGDAIARYRWTFDGKGRVDTRTPTLRHTFRKNGVFPVTLTVTTRSGKRGLPATQDIVVGNTPPVVTIDAPADGTSVAAGALVTLVGHATDAEDGELPCSRLEWDIRRGHNAHSHPWLFLRYGCSTIVQAAEIADHGSGSGFSLAIELRATDDGGPGVPPLTGRAGIRLPIQ
jgi:glucose/arabinose dehydrogenase